MSAGHPQELPSSPGHQHPGEARPNAPRVAAAGPGPRRDSQDPAPGGSRGESESLYLVATGHVQPQGAAQAPTEADPVCSPFLGVSAFQPRVGGSGGRAGLCFGEQVSPLENRACVAGVGSLDVLRTQPGVQGLENIRTRGPWEIILHSLVLHVKTRGCAMGSKDFLESSSVSWASGLNFLSLTFLTLKCDHREYLSPSSVGIHWRWVGR